MARRQFAKADAWNLHYWCPCNSRCFQQTDVLLAAARRAFATFCGWKLQVGRRSFLIPSSSRFSGSWLLRGVDLQHLVREGCKLASVYLQRFQIGEFRGLGRCMGAQLQHLSFESCRPPFVYSRFIEFAARYRRSLINFPALVGRRCSPHPE